MNHASMHDWEYYNTRINAYSTVKYWEFEIKKFIYSGLIFSRFSWYIQSIIKSVTKLITFYRDHKKLDENEGELDSVRQEINTCWNDSYERIQELASQIDIIDASLNDLIAQTKSTVENKINSVKSSLTSRIIIVQNQVSDMNTNVDDVQTGLGNFEDSTNNEFSKVWKKFKEVDKEIANLPQNSGSIKNGRYYAIICVLLVIICNKVYTL